MDLPESRSSTLKGTGLCGLAASDGVGWVNSFDGQQQSGHSYISQKNGALQRHMTYSLNSLKGGYIIRGLP